MRLSPMRTTTPPIRLSSLWVRRVISLPVTEASFFWIFSCCEEVSSWALVTSATTMPRASLDRLR